MNMVLVESQMDRKSCFYGVLLWIYSILRGKTQQIERIVSCLATTHTHTRA